MIEQLVHDIVPGVLYLYHRTVVVYFGDGELFDLAKRWAGLFNRINQTDVVRAVYNTFKMFFVQIHSRNDKRANKFGSEVRYFFV